jgi:hypothetical protein
MNCARPQRPQLFERALLNRQRTPASIEMKTKAHTKTPAKKKKTTRKKQHPEKSRCCHVPRSPPRLSLSPVAWHKTKPNNPPKNQATKSLSATMTTGKEVDAGWNKPKQNRP